MLKRNERVVFYKDSHHYELDGIKFLKGITTMLKDQGLSPAEYADIDPKVLHNAALRGTAVHDMLEKYDNGESLVNTDVRNEDGEVLMTAADLDKTLKAYKKKAYPVIASEWLISDNDIVASSIDKVESTEKEDEYTLVDIKTSSDPKHESYRWQLSIYAYLFEHQHPGAKAVNLIIRHIRDCKIKDYPVERIPDSEIEKLLTCEKFGLMYQQETTATGELTELFSEGELMSIKNALGALAELETVRKQVDEVLDAAKEKLASYMESHSVTELVSEGVTAKFRAGYERTSIDSAKLKKLYPDIAEECSKTSVTKGSVTLSI